MVPMRSVPHRVIALLGLDDGVFPRGGGIDGDDVLQRSPHLGERDPRSEDRQMLLDAIMSATDHLLLLFTGADPVTGAPRPPAVALGEVLDVLRRTTGDPELRNVLRQHPLQPFDQRNFQRPEPFSYDAAAFAGAHAAAADRHPEPPFLQAPFPASQADLEVKSLASFLVHPTKAFLGRRLGLYIPDDDDAVLDDLHVELDGLQKWDIAERMLAAWLSGVEPQDFRHAEWRRGTLPPGPLGERLLNDLELQVEPLVRAAREVHVGAASTFDVLVDLGSGRVLTGTVAGIHDTVLASTSYSKLGPKHRLTAWVNLLAVAASGGPELTAVTTGRGPFRRPVWRSTLALPPSPLDALVDMVALYDDGMRRPLPIATDSSTEYAERRARGDSVDDATEAAAKAWGGLFGDSKDRHLAYVMGTPPQFSDVTRAVAGDAEGTQFGQLARRLWSPLLGCETLGQP